MEEEPCLYTRIGKNGTITIMFVYVDDIFVASNKETTLINLTNRLQKSFKLKVLGIPQQLLGVQIKWGEDFSSVHLSISKLINSLQHQFEMLNCNSEPVPMRPGIRFVKADCPSKEEVRDKRLQKLQKKYRILVGTYIFICQTCRPDIMYAVNILCRAMSNPSVKHYEAALHLLRYLAGTKEAGIRYFRIGNYIIVYADADDGADETRRSCAAYIIFFAGGPIAWSSKFIKEYALSTCESEIRAIAAALPAIRAILYIKKLLIEIYERGLIGEEEANQFKMLMSTPLTILEDNKAAIDWSGKSISTQRMLHVERSLYWIRQYTAERIIKLEYIESAHQLADIGTKPVPVTIFKQLSQSIISYQL